jgi:protein-arginine kinase activator protein McsA
VNQKIIKLKNLEFEEAARLRDVIKEREKQELFAA